MSSVVIWRFGGSDGPVVDGTIEAASWADEGVYLCRLSNSEVEAVMRDIELRIVGEDASCTCSHRLQGGWGHRSGWGHESGQSLGGRGTKWEGEGPMC